MSEWNSIKDVQPKERGKYLVFACNDIYSAEWTGREFIPIYDNLVTLCCFSETLPESSRYHNVSVGKFDLSPEYWAILPQEPVFSKFFKETPDYEMFLDKCYYATWCIRNKNDRRFDSPMSFHFEIKEDAEKFLELISKAK